MNTFEFISFQYSVPNLRVTTGRAKRNVGSPTPMRSVRLGSADLPVQVVRGRADVSAHRCNFWPHLTGARAL